MQDNPADNRLRQLIVPEGALGGLADLVRWLAAIQQTHQPAASPRALLIFCADHPVAGRGVSAYPPEVTGAMVDALVGGHAAASVLARQLDVELQIHDVGVATPYALASRAPGVRHARYTTGAGAGDLACEPALTPALRERCRAIGHAAVMGLPDTTRLLLLGEVGIGNTTVAAALISALSGRPAEEVVGRGTGVDDAGLRRKQTVTAEAVARVPHGASPLEVLDELGGREVAALVGAFEAAAARDLPVLVDGVVVTAAACVADRLVPDLRRLLRFGHRSDDRAHQWALAALGASPVLDLGLRVGEGTGALAALPLLDLALSLYDEMATFADLGVPERS